LIIYSKDGGVTWSTDAVPLGFVAGEPWIAADRKNSKNLYVAFQKSLKDNSIHIYMISSNDGGVTWSNSVRLDDVLTNDTVDHTFPSMDSSPSGRLFVAWRDYRNTISKTWFNSNTTDIYAYSNANPRTNIRISNSTARYCGPFSPCYRVSGNDYFGVASGDSADHVAFSLDENGNSWPEAYDSIVEYSTTSSLYRLLATAYQIVVSIYPEFVAVVVASVAVAFIIVLRRRSASKIEESHSSPSLANQESRS
jgi:hypothetical protein